MMNNNIEFNIKTNKGVGITYGLDAKLDEHFNRDVKLNASTWNSIMNIVKNDKALDKKQYSGGDTDIHNGKHFIVQKDIYTITANAWNQIVAIASKVVNGDTPTNDTQIKENETKKLTNEQIKNEINRLLENKITDLDDSIMNELIERYKQIKSENVIYNDAMLALRLENYVYGRINHQKSIEWSKIELGILEKVPNIEEYTAEDLANALSRTEAEKFDLKKDDDKISMHKLEGLSMQYLEYADTNNNKNIDLIEFYRKDLISYYQTFEKLDINEAIKKAENKMKELNLNTPQDIINYAKTINANSNVGEEITLIGSILQFDTLNQDNDLLNLNMDEIMTYHAAMANFNTKDNKLDIGDYSLFNNSITNPINLNINGQTFDKTKHMLNGYYDAIKDFKAN